MSAKRLASMGRNGDTHLLHISGPELQALARTGKLTYNPETGLPEAFSLGGFLGDIFSFAAPAIGGFFGGPPGAALGGALGSAVQGGNPLIGAVSGGLGNVAGGAFGGDLGGFGPGDVVESELAGSFGGMGGGEIAGAATGAGADGVFSNAGLENFPSDMDFGTSGLSLLGGGMTDILPRIMNSLETAPWGTVSKGIDAFQGLYGLDQARKLQRLAQMRMAQLDPYGPYRAQAAQQLASLSANPGLITKTPGWDAGIQAVRRSAAGRGYLDSGNEISMLQNFGGEAFNKESARLAGLAGANFNPATAASLEMAGNEGALNLMGQSLNRLSRSIGGFGRA